MSPLRIAGFVLVAVASLFLVGNIWYWLIGEGNGLSLYDVWYKFAPGLLVLAQRWIWGPAWNFMMIALVQPAWIIVGVIGLLCIGIGRRKVE